MQTDDIGIDAVLPNSRQWTLPSAKGRSYLLQVAWPLAWASSKQADVEPVPVFWVLDGNAYFFSAVEAVRRAAVHPGSISGIVIGVGYPPTAPFPFDARRSYDLTPPSPHYVPPRDQDGNEYPLKPGGATEFLDYIVGDAKRFLFEEAKGGFIEKNVLRHVLVGHSYGGLCSLHALFSNYRLFDSFVALSPSIFWNDKFILTEQETFLNGEEQHERPSVRKPSLYISYGEYEQVPRRLPNWTDEEYEKWLDHARGWDTAGNAQMMAKTLEESGRFEKIRVKPYADEDHISAAICGLNWAVSCIVNPQRFE